MDEQNKPITQQATANVPDYSNEINAMYDAQRASQQQQLESAYNKNLATLQQGREDIAGVYNTQANDLATQYERNRRNNNFQADLNGLNTGTASQMQLAQNNAYMRGYGQLRAAQAADERRADRDIANLAIDYKNAVAEALAQNDYQRATDLLKEHQRRDAAAQDEARYQYDIRFAEQKYADQMAQQALENQRYDTKWQQSLKEYENQLAQQQLQNERYDTEWAAQQQQYADKLAAQQWEQQYKERAYNDTMSQQQAEDALNAAKIRAAYGDFGGYEALYGKETADAMREFWIQANPNYAYANGLISEDTYNKLLGISQSSGSSSGGSGGYRRSSGGNNPNNNPNGPGAIDGQNPTTATNEPLSERDAYNADRAALLADIDRYGSEKGAYVARMQNQQMAAQGQAEMAAVANGLKPGTTAYRTFVAEQKNYILSTDADYIANQKAVNALGEQQKLEEQKKQAAFEAQYGKAGAVSYDYNAQQSAADSEKAFASASTYTPTPAKNTSKNSNVTSASSQAGKEIRAKGGSGGNTTTNKKANKTR